MDPIFGSRVCYISGDEDALSAEVEKLKSAAGIEIGSGDRLYLADIASGVVHVCGQGAHLPKHLKHWTLVFHADEEEATLNAQYFYKITVHFRGHWEIEYAAAFKETPVETLLTVETFVQTCLRNARSLPTREALVQGVMRLPPLKQGDKKLAQPVALLAIQLAENGERALAEQLLSYAELQGILVRSDNDRSHTAVLYAFWLVDLLAKLDSKELSAREAYLQWKKVYDQELIVGRKVKNLELLAAIAPVYSTPEVQESLRTAFVAFSSQYEDDIDHILPKMIKVAEKLLNVKPLKTACDFFLLILPHVKENSLSQGALEGWIELYGGKLREHFKLLELPRMVTLMEESLLQGRRAPTTWVSLVARHALEYLKRGDCSQIPRVWNLFFTALARLERVESLFTEAFVRYLRENPSACDELRKLALPLPALLDQITRDEKYAHAKELLADRLEVAGMLKSEPCYRKLLVQAMEAKTKLRSPEQARHFLERIGSFLSAEELFSCRIELLKKLPQRARADLLLSFLESNLLKAQRDEVRELVQALVDTNEALAHYLPDAAKRDRILDRLSQLEQKELWRQCGELMLTLDACDEGRVALVCKGIFFLHRGSAHTKRNDAELLVALVKKFPGALGWWIEPLCLQLSSEKNYTLFDTLFDCLPHPISPTIWLLRLARLRYSKPKHMLEEKKSFLEQAPHFTLEALGAEGWLDSYVLLMEAAEDSLVMERYHDLLFSEGTEIDPWNTRIEYLRELVPLLSPKRQRDMGSWLLTIDFSKTSFKNGISLLAALAVFLPSIGDQEMAWGKLEEAVRCYGTTQRAYIAKVLHALLVYFPTQQRLVRCFIDLKQNIAPEEMSKYRASIYCLSVHAGFSFHVMKDLNIPDIPTMERYYAEMLPRTREHFRERVVDQLDYLSRKDFEEPIAFFRKLRLFVGYITLTKAAIAITPGKLRIQGNHIAALLWTLEGGTLMLEGGTYEVEGSTEREMLEETVAYAKSLVTDVSFPTQQHLEVRSEGTPLVDMRSYVDWTYRLCALQKRLSLGTSQQPELTLTIQAYSKFYSSKEEEILACLSSCYFEHLSSVKERLHVGRLAEVLPAYGWFLSLSLMLPEYLELFDTLTSSAPTRNIVKSSLQQGWNRAAWEMEIHLKCATWSEEDRKFCKPIVERIYKAIREARSAHPPLHASRLDA